MEYENKILKLFENGYLTTKNIVNNGIPRIYLTKLVKNGVIERVSRGVYVKKDVLVDEFVILQSKSKYAIYSNTTALYLYGFSNRIPIKYDITVKNGYKGSLQKEDNVNLFYTKKELYDLLGKSPRIFDHNLMAGSNDPDYLNNLIKISNMDEKLVMHYTALLMNPHFIKSSYKEFDLKVLESITNFDIFMDLYTLIYEGLDMVDNTHHQSDIILLSKTLDSKIRKWLIKRITNENNNNYDYDIEYITKLKLDSISDEIKEEMKYYLFKEKGINDLKHREKLESLLNGIMVERHESLTDYLNKLEEELNTKEVEEPLLVPSVEESVSKAKSRVLSLFKKDKI